MARFAEFLREASVLIFVFTSLERFLLGEATTAFLVVTLGLSIYLFAAAIALELALDSPAGGD